MRIPTATLLFLLIGVRICHGEQLFVGILETESYHSLELSVAAFASVTRAPELNAQLKAKTSRFTALPVIAGFAKDKRLRVIQSVDPSELLSDLNPASTAIIPMLDDGREVEHLLNENYSLCTLWRPNINVYSKPASTNIFPSVAIAKQGQWLLASRSPEALLWVMENPKLLNAPPLPQKGALKYLVNPQRAAAILNARGDLTLLQFFKPTEVLLELEMCSLALALEAQSLTISAEATPLQGTPLAALAEALRKPESALLNSAPADAFLSAVSKCEEPEIWNRFALNLQQQIAPALAQLNTKKIFTGERAQYLAPSKDKKGLIFVQLEPLHNAAPLLDAIKTLDTTTPSDAAIYLEKIATPAAAQSNSLRYKLHLKPRDEQTAPSAIHTIVSLFIKHAYLELAIRDNLLITVVGPQNSLAEVVSSIPGSPRKISLLAELDIRNDSFNQNPLSGIKLELTKLLRFTASLIPNITQQQLATLPEGGYGLTFGLDKVSGATVKGSLQISADEFSALRNISTSGRELMQRLLMSMLTQRIERIELPPEQE
ncbi:MAG: hypothetical protein PHO37_02130 [Kiritimatiellae bacterium]|nr:hypothetical protein [Kiritimatiellia bacterium]